MYANLPSPLGNQRIVGMALVATATVAWSLSGVYARLLSVDLWTTVAWRSLLGAAFLLIAGATLRAGTSAAQWRSLACPAGCLLILAHVLNQIFFIGALHMTSIANFTVIAAITPFTTALMARLFLRERVGSRVIIAGGLCLVGVAITVTSSIGGKTGVGDLLALAMTITFSVITLVPRSNPKLAILPSTVAGGLATFVLCVPMSTVSTLDGMNWLLLAGFGATNFCLALFCFLAGAKRMQPAQAALIANMEVVLTPLWVWLFFKETPATATLIGGVLVLVTVLVNAVIDLRQDPRNEKARL